MPRTADACKLSVVIPSRNDGTRIDALLGTVCGHLSPRRGWEVLVVDDASDDDTCVRVLGFSMARPDVYLLRDPCPLGCGYAARHGVNLARGERIALLSPDLPAPIACLDRLEAALDEGHDLAFISFRADRDRRMPPVRIRSELIRALLTSTPKPQGHGGPPRPSFFQLYRRRAAVELFRRQRLHGPTFAVEILYLAGRYGYSALEVAAEDTPKGSAETGEVGELFRIRMHRLRGDYG